MNKGSKRHFDDVDSEREQQQKVRQEKHQKRQERALERAIRNGRILYEDEMENDFR